MKKIVLTGFTAFGDNSFNPTERVVRVLEKEDRIETFVLPVVYDRCADIIRNTDADIYLHLGLAASRKNLTIEKNAYNEKKAKARDNAGILFSGEKIIESGEDVLTTAFDTERIMSDLRRKGMESSISTDPGRYVCNNIYYHSLSIGRKALFVHLPPFDFLSPDDAVRAVRTIIESLSSQA